MALRCIVLTKAQADAVRGPTDPGHALVPIALRGGSAFVLPERVLTDAVHARRRTALAARPVREILPDELQDQTDV